MIFKKKPIKIEAYAPTGSLIDFFPITTAKEALPQWYHNLPKDYSKHNTVKHCAGIRDLFSTGFIVPSWGEYDITVTPTGEALIDSPVVQLQGHSSQHHVDEEAPGAWPGYTNVKLHNPWWFWCDTPIKWMLIGPAWNQQDPQQYTTIPGIVEFRYNHQANVNTLFKIQKNNYVTKIKPGDALLHMIPITEEPCEIELKVMTDDVYTNKFAGWQHSFNLGYQKIRNIMDKRNKL
jgi:hypothetical protein